MGRSRRSPLFPLFRSDAQARVLATVFLAPTETPLSQRLIAERAGLPYSTVQREVAVLERAGIVQGSVFGTAKVVRPDRSSPYVDEIESLVLKTYGPATILAAALADVPGVAEAYIFGSWAARYHGEHGPDPGDIDVLVVVDDKDADQLAIELRLAAESERLGREVNTVFTRLADWSVASSSFLTTVKARPLVPLEVPRDVA